MKAKITILALVLCLPLFLAAQDNQDSSEVNITDSITPQKGYKSFFGENKTKYSYAIPVWCKSNYDNKMEPYQRLGCCFTEEATINSDDTTTLNGKTYYKCSSFFNNYYFREDTVHGKIYRYKNGTNETLVCDMSLVKGDTFNLPTTQGQGNIPLIVDTVFWDTEGRKIIYFSMGNSCIIPSSFSQLRTDYYNIPMFFIEGIGPIYSPMGGHLSPGLTTLLCVEKDDTLTYMTNELLGCYQFLASVKDKDKVSLHVYPNPASQRVLVEVEGWNGAGTLRLINSVGMVLQTVKMEDAITELNISKYANGLYTILYTDDKNNRTAVKFVKQE